MKCGGCDAVGVVGVGWCGSRVEDGGMMGAQGGESSAEERNDHTEASQGDGTAHCFRHFYVLIIFRLRGAGW